MGVVVQNTVMLILGLGLGKKVKAKSLVVLQKSPIALTAVESCLVNYISRSAFLTYLQWTRVVLVLLKDEVICFSHM